MNKALRVHRKRIEEICQEYRVERLDLFGSATYGAFDNQHSDYDFIVRFADPDQPGVAQRYFGLAEELEHVLGRPVDLLTDRPFRNPYFAQSVAESRETIYEAHQQEVSVRHPGSL
jgi:predicted nucleotidyltransferase